MASPRATAAAAATVALVCIVATCGVAAQDCSTIPGCTACQDVNVTRPPPHHVATGNSRRPPPRARNSGPPQVHGGHNNTAVNTTRPLQNETHTHHNGSHPPPRNVTHLPPQNGTHPPQNRTHPPPQNDTHHPPRNESQHNTTRPVETRLMCTACGTPGYVLNNRTGRCGGWRAGRRSCFLGACTRLRAGRASPCSVMRRSRVAIALGMALAEAVGGGMFARCAGSRMALRRCCVWPSCLGWALSHADTGKHPHLNLLAHPCPAPIHAPGCAAGFGITAPIPGVPPPPPPHYCL